MHARNKSKQKEKERESEVSAESYLCQARVCSAPCEEIDAVVQLKLKLWCSGASVLVTLKHDAGLAVRLLVFANVSLCVYKHELVVLEGDVAVGLAKRKVDFAVL